MVLWNVAYVANGKAYRKSEEEDQLFRKIGYS